MNMHYIGSIVLQSVIWSLIAALSTAVIVWVYIRRAKRASRKAIDNNPSIIKDAEINQWSWILLKLRAEPMTAEGVLNTWITQKFKVPKGYQIFGKKLPSKMPSDDEMLAILKRMESLGFVKFNKHNNNWITDSRSFIEILSHTEHKYPEIKDVTPLLAYISFEYETIDQIFEKWRKLINSKGNDFRYGISKNIEDVMDALKLLYQLHGVFIAVPLEDRSNDSNLHFGGNFDKLLSKNTLYLKL